MSSSRFKITEYILVSTYLGGPTYTRLDISLNVDRPSFTTMVSPDAPLETKNKAIKEAKQDLIRFLFNEIMEGEGLFEDEKV